jgi:serine/threonine-protein kinase ULK/ATG1
MPPIPSAKRASSSSSKALGPPNAKQEEEELRPYVRVAYVGKGSFSTVYKGYHEVRATCLLLSTLILTTSTLQESHQQVAIKVVERNKLTAKLFDNLQSEIDILKSLSHRHITRLVDIVVRQQCLLSSTLDILCRRRNRT